MGTLLRAVLIPSALEACNAGLRAIAHDAGYAGASLDLASSLVSVFACVWAGWMVGRAGQSLARGVLAGLVVWFVSCVVIAGGPVVISAMLAGAGPKGEPGFVLFLSLRYFALFAPVAAVASALGWAIGRRRTRQDESAG